MKTDEAEVFAAFCGAGLWPGLGRTLAELLPEHGITGPDDVAVSTLRELPKVSKERARKLATAFQDARTTYEVLELLLPARLEPRLAGRAVDALGSSAVRILTEDPWRLLHLPAVAPGEADRFARTVIDGVRPDDPRRARALVFFVLTRQARDGHTVTPRSQIVELLREFHVSGAADTDAAIEAALASGDIVEGLIDGAAGGDAAGR